MYNYNKYIYICMYIYIYIHGQDGCAAQGSAFCAEPVFYEIRDAQNLFPKHET